LIDAESRPGAGRRLVEIVHVAFLRRGAEHHVDPVLGERNIPMERAKRRNDDVVFKILRVQCSRSPWNACHSTNGANAQILQSKQPTESLSSSDSSFVTVTSGFLQSGQRFASEGRSGSKFEVRGSTRVFFTGHWRCGMFRLL
jgi:hypothetical protein